MTTENNAANTKTPQGNAPKKSCKKKARFTLKAVVKNIFSGLIIGSSILVPSLNIGMTAIILGIYDSLNNAIGTIFKRFTYNFLYIMQLAIGGIAGILLLSNMVLNLVQKFEYPMTYLFMGAMLGSIPSVYRKGKIKHFNPLYLLWILAGGGFIYAVNLLPKSNLNLIPTSFQDYIMLFLCGTVIAVSLMLPGIRTLHILFAIGMYESVWLAIRKLDFLCLLPVLLGILAGTLLTAKILDSALRRFSKQTHLLIIGFVLASIINIFPGIPTNYLAIACTAGFIFGAGGIYLISK